MVDLPALFEKHALIPDGDHDETDNPFYTALGHFVESHGDMAVSVIEDCIFRFERTAYDSVYNAIYFCGRLADKTGSKKYIRVLERVLAEHANSTARLYACEALGDIGRLDVLKKAYEQETDESVKFRIARFYVVKEDIKTIVQDEHGRACIEHKLMPVFYRSNYRAGNPTVEKQQRVLEESITCNGIEKTAAALRMMVSHELTPQYVSSHMARMVEKSCNAELAAAFAK